MVTCLIWQRVSEMPPLHAPLYKAWNLHFDWRSLGAYGASLLRHSSSPGHAS